MREKNVNFGIHVSPGLLNEKPKYGAAEFETKRSRSQGTCYGKKANLNFFFSSLRPYLMITSSPTSPCTFNPTAVASMTLNASLLTICARKKKNGYKISRMFSGTFSKRACCIYIMLVGQLCANISTYTQN